MENIGCDWRTALGRFAEDVELLRLSEDREHFWACKEPLGRLVASGAVTHLVAEQLRLCTSANAHCPALRLWETNGVSLVLRLVEYSGKDDAISSATEHRLIAVIAGNVSVERFHGAERAVHDHGKLVPDGTTMLNTGDMAELHASKDVCRLSTAIAAVYFEARSTPCCRFQHIFDGKTLAFRRTVFTGITDMLISVALEAASHLGSAESGECAAGLFAHPNPFVRQLALKTAGKVDPANRDRYEKTFMDVNGAAEAGLWR